MKMNEKKCCVPSCQQTRADNTILHLFPNPKKELDRFNKWIYAIGGNVLVLDPLVIFKYGRVCHSHFDPKYYTSSKRLSKIAVPSLYLAGISFNPRPALQEVTNVLKETFTSQPTPSTSHQPVASTLKDLIIQRPALQELPNVLKETSLGTDKKKNIKLKTFDSNTIFLRNKIKKLQRHKDSLLNRLKKALKLSENTAFQKALGKFSATANMFTNLQFREAGKHKKGCRFTNQEKVMALALYKQGPRAYRWLQKFFVLPSPLTLSRMISRASLHPGINENLFRQLEKKVRKMKTLEKLSILLFDEVALTAHFDYNRRTDRVNGFVNNGTKKQNKIADHALVFMVRGVQKNYKQPIAYTFCSSTTPAVELALQIKVVLRKLQSIGLNVIATVCDQGSTNVSAINWLIKTTKDEYLRQGKLLKHDIFEVDKKEIVPLYDPPHLIKGIRNNLINKNLKFRMDGQEKTAKWDHITKVYNENLAYKGIRLMPKITDRHIIPHKMAKMKVKCATQLFSQTVAAYMGLLSRVGVLPKECEDTADILIFFDNLFDSVNGSYNNYNKRRGKPLLGPVTPSSTHKTVWLEAKKVLNTMRFCNNNKSSVVPSIKHWLQTIENIEYIVKMLSDKYNLTSLWMRHFNQDPLENFFGCIRSHGYRNISPSCAGFESAFASLLINNLNSMHSPGANCENDNCNNFQSLQALFFSTPETSSYTMEVDFDDVNSDNIFVDIEIKRSDPKIKAQLDYVTGYVLKKLNLKCKNCRKSLYEKIIRDDCAISVREFVKNKHSLTYPSIALINCFSNIQDVVTCILRKDSKKDNIRQYIKTIFSVVMDYKFIKCKEHKKEIVSKIEDICINIFIYNWCKDTNKILCGSRKDFDAEDLVQKFAFDYSKKRLK